MIDIVFRVRFRVLSLPNIHDTPCNLRKEGEKYCNVPFKSYHLHKNYLKHDHIQARVRINMKFQSLIILIDPKAKT